MFTSLEKCFEITYPFISDQWQIEIVKEIFWFSLPRPFVADRLISLKLEQAPWIDERIVNISNDDYMDGLDGWMDVWLLTIHTIG